MNEVDPAKIIDYHAHVYFTDARTRALAVELREEIAVRFPVALGRVHDRPVGPHTQPMFQVAFATELFGRFVPWLSLNHKGLSVLIHPETGDDPIDHSEYALWLGEKLPVDIEYLRNLGA
ncbi:MAG TPA: DOPA 4,5-dioxygenase family protein [Alphaproteobacteria bacterium]